MSKWQESIEVVITLSLKVVVWTAGTLYVDLTILGKPLRITSKYHLWVFLCNWHEKCINLSRLERAKRNIMSNANLANAASVRYHAGQPGAVGPNVVNPTTPGSQVNVYVDNGQYFQKSGNLSSLHSPRSYHQVRNNRMIPFSSLKLPITNATNYKCKSRSVHGDELGIVLRD
jgi:hypothetical protein